MSTLASITRVVFNLQNCHLYTASRDMPKSITSPNVSLEQSISGRYEVVWNDKSPLTGTYNNCLVFTTLHYYKLLVILLLYGDVEHNPGPKTHYPCSICCLSVFWNQ